MKRILIYKSGDGPVSIASCYLFANLCYEVEIVCFSVGGLWMKFKPI